jgi:uncharacterized protein YbjT (DUF2867 family)
MSERNVLVVGATGTVGSAAVNALKGAKAKVGALVRGPRELPAHVTAVRGDLRDEASLDRALDGVHAALFVAPLEPDEEALAEMFVRACERSGTRIVFVGVHVDGANVVSRFLKRAVYGQVLSHYRPKFRLSERVRSSKANPIVLVPTNYFQNDEMFFDQISSGRYSQAFLRPINRVDVRDLGEAAARALLDPSLSSRAYPVIGPASLTAEECAATWSEALGIEVRAGGSFEEGLANTVDGKKRDDFVATYAVLKKLTLATDPAQLAETTALIGHPPRSYRDYVRDAAMRLRDMTRACAASTSSPPSSSRPRSRPVHTPIASAPALTR